MKLLILRLCTVFLFTAVVSSCHNNREKEPRIDTFKKKILGSSRSNIISVDNLYDNQVSESKDLKKLEDSITAIQQMISDTFAHINEYVNTSKYYYSDAKAIANRFKDSALKSRILVLISGSQKRYMKLISADTLLVKQIENNDTLMDDYHNFLKIAVTLPVIEKYQNDNLPPAQSLKEVLTRQNNVNRLIIKNTYVK